MAEHLTTAEPNAVIADQGMVYARFPNGEIQPVDASPMELMKKINRGIQPLPDYGQFGSCVYYMDHPFEPLFQAGGAHEMSVQQVVSLGYHLRPPKVPTCELHCGMSKDHLVHKGSVGARSAKAQGCWRGARPVYFPQLEGQTFEEPPECEFCGRDDLPTMAAFKQHQDVMHNDRRQQQSLADAIVFGLQRGGAISGADSAQTIAATVAAVLQTMGYGNTAPPRPSASPDEDEDDQDQEAFPTDVRIYPKADPKREARNLRRRESRRARTQRAQAVEA